MWWWERYEAYCTEMWFGFSSYLCWFSLFSLQNQKNQAFWYFPKGETFRFVSSPCQHFFWFSFCYFILYASVWYFVYGWCGLNRGRVRFQRLQNLFAPFSRGPSRGLRPWFKTLCMMSFAGNGRASSSSYSTLRDGNISDTVSYIRKAFPLFIYLFSQNDILFLIGWMLFSIHFFHLEFQIVDTRY